MANRVWYTLFSDMVSLAEVKKVARLVMEKRDSLRTVRRALSILDCFSVQQQELSLTQIANQIDLAKSTTTRLLSSLETERLIHRDEQTGKYKLGIKLISLGQIAKDSYPLKGRVSKLMEKLRDETLETVNLYTLDQGKRICIHQFEGYQPLRHAVRIGEMLPLSSGAGGKLLLAYQPKHIQDKVLAELDPTTLEERILELEQIRETGIAVSREERELGLAAIAAAVFNEDGSVTHCISLSGLMQRFSEEKLSDYQQILTDALRKVNGEKRL